MGIELGSIGSAAGSVATAVGRGISGLGRIGGEAPVAASAPVRVAAEGPVSSLEGFTPMTKVSAANLDLIGGTYKPGFNPFGEILFQAKPQISRPAAEMNEVSVLAGVEHILAEARKVEPKTVNQDWEVIWPQTKPIIAPAEVPVAVPQIRPTEAPVPPEAGALKAEPKVQGATEINVKAVQKVLPTVKQAEAEQETEVVEHREKEQPKEVLEESEERKRKIFTEDNEVTAQRKFDVKAAVRRAKEVAAELGWEKITGALIAKYMPAEYAGVRSRVIKETGPDGSYQETVEEIAGYGEFISEIKAEEYSYKVIDRKKPVKWGEKGTPLSFEHVIRVFKYRIIKPIKAHTEVVTRAVKKKLVMPQSETGVSASLVTEKAPEPTIKDFPQFAQALKAV